jgi:hypothetical protein
LSHLGQLSDAFCDGHRNSVKRKTAQKSVQPLNDARYDFSGTRALITGRDLA